MAYEVIILGHLHMPLYFLETFTEYPYVIIYTRINVCIYTTIGLIYYVLFLQCYTSAFSVDTPERNTFLLTERLHTPCAIETAHYEVHRYK